MSETLKTLKTRRSCRSYKPELIEKEKLDGEEFAALMGDAPATEGETE